MKVNCIRRRRRITRNATPKKVEGYWRNFEQEESQYPWPIPNQLTDKEIDKYKTALLAVQNSKDIRGSRFKGISHSRLTGESLGTSEFYYNDWKWPEGLIHYIEHGVKPTDNFIQEVLTPFIITL